MILKDLKIPIALAAVVITLALVSGFYKSCTSDPKAEYWRGMYEEMAARHTLLQADSAVAIEALQHDIEERDEKIAEHEANADDLSDTIAGNRQEIDRLEAELSAIDPSEKDAIIDNLSAQVNKWRDQFNLSQSIIEEKDAVIFNLKKKFDDQVKLTEQFKGLYHSESDLHEVALKRLEIADKTIKRLKFGSGVKNTLIIGAIGLIVYDLVKK